MKRLAMVSVFLTALLAGAGVSTAAAAAQPSPSPSPSASLDPNTAQVCTQTGDTVEQGIKAFTAEIQKAGTAAANRDLAGAEGYIKQSGTVLTNVASQLTTQAGEAQNPELKAALQEAATELQTLGASLTSLTSLENFDTRRFVALAVRVAAICRLT